MDKTMEKFAKFQVKEIDSTTNSKHLDLFNRTLKVLNLILVLTYFPLSQ